MDKWVTQPSLQMNESKSYKFFLEASPRKEIEVQGEKNS